MVLTRRASLEDEGRRLVERLGGRWGPAGGMCRCPAHDDQVPSLSIRLGRSRLLLHCFAGCTTPDVLRCLRDMGEAVSEGRVERGAGVELTTGLGRAAARLWSEARDPAGTLLERYLASRHLPLPREGLRFHPRTPDGPRPLTSFRPAMIAAVRDTGGLVAVHRTFLEQRGDVPCVLTRAALGRLGQGAVRLGGDVGAVLGLAEGIETALSASLLFGVPCWATLGAERFGRIELPPQVSRLLLFVDHDQGGLQAERIARAAFAHMLSVEAHRPGTGGEDWNDVLQRHGSSSPFQEER